MKIPEFGSDLLIFPGSVVESPFGCVNPGNNE